MIDNFLTKYVVLTDLSFMVKLFACKVCVTRNEIFTSKGIKEASIAALDLLRNL